MKYGESAFDVLYLLFAIISGILILKNARSKSARQMGLAALILGCGDAFHLVPRVMNYFTETDLTAALGIGKLVTSLTMTVFYVLLYPIWQGVYGEKQSRRTAAAVLGLAVLRIVLCAFPQNGWVENSSDMLWGILRNIPFVALGAVIFALYYKNREKNRLFRYFSLLILLSFLFYIPVAVAAGVLPILGMLMLPKTICYILMIVIFLRYCRQDRADG